MNEVIARHNAKFGMQSGKLTSFPTSTVLMLTYYGGANLFECGLSFAKVTGAYFVSDALLSWCALVTVILYMWCCAYFVLKFRGKQYKGSAPLPPKLKSSRAIVFLWRVLAWLLVLPILLLCSIPIVAQELITSIPEDSVLNSGLANISSDFGARNVYDRDHNYVHSAVNFGILPGIILFENSVILPIACRALAKYIAGTMSDSSRMMCFAQIMNTIVVPVAVVVLIDQECSALYLQLWNRCQDAKLR